MDENPNTPQKYGIQGIPTVIFFKDGEVAKQLVGYQAQDKIQKAIDELVPMIEQSVPGIPNARWVAIRLLDGDSRVQSALVNGELPDLMARQRRAEAQFSRKMAVQGRQ